MGVPAKAGTLLPRFKIAPFADGFHHRGSTGLPQGEKPKQGQGAGDMRGPTVSKVNLSASSAIALRKGGTFRLRDRKSVVQGKSVSVRVHRGGRRNNNNTSMTRDTRR